MSLQKILSLYCEKKAAVRAPRCVSAETVLRTGGGKRKTLEDVYAFIADCELAIRDMGKWGIILLKYLPEYLQGFTVPTNKEHKIAHNIALRMFGKRGLL